MSEYTYGNETFDDQYDRMPRKLAEEAKVLGVTKTKAKEILRADTSGLENYRAWKKKEEKKRR